MTPNVKVTICYGLMFHVDVKRP